MEVIYDMNKKIFLVFTHSDKKGYYYKYGKKEDMEKEKINSRTSHADTNVPPKGVINKMLMYPLTMKSPLLILHRDSDKIPGGETRPAHHIEAYTIFSDLHKAPEYLTLILVGAVFGYWKIYCLDTEKSISTASAAMFETISLLPQEQKKQFYIRLINLTDIPAFLESSKDCFLICENNVIRLPNNLLSGSNDEKCLSRYINEVKKAPDNIIKDIENERRFSTNNYIDIIRNRYTETLPPLKFNMKPLINKPLYKEKTISERDALLRMTNYCVEKINKKGMFKRHRLLKDLNEYYFSLESATQKENEFIQLIISFVKYNSSYICQLIFINSLRSYIDNINSGYQANISAQQLMYYYKTLKKLNRIDLMKYMCINSDFKALKLYDTLISKI